MTAFSLPLSYTVVTIAVASQAFAAGEASDDSYWKKDPSTWQVEIHPNQLWLPYMSAKVTLPEYSSGGMRPSGRATSSLDSGYSGALRWTRP